ncbi:MAG TPA: DUF1634 domain-containing protein [Candidatus Limnocylindria bacterium]|nr:DUF1634 domain-containing protein [Candidatus Limnocylindria bacterium]
MTRSRDLRDIGPPIARTLRIGTLLAVACIGAGYVLEALTGQSATGSIIELIANGGVGALIGLGFLTLTFTPLVAVAVAAVLLAQRRERGRALAASLAFGLLLASLFAAALLGRSS